MRNLRSINKVNEDNASGFHSNTVYTGADRAVTGGNDAPLPVTQPSVQPPSSGSSGGSNTDNPSTPAIDNPSTPATTDGDHSSVGDGLAWFETHWKEIAIVAGAAALILAISKLIKGLNKSIKIRYNRVVKTLQKAQKDFTSAEDGLNMKSVMPGIGSRIYDWISRMWAGNWKSKEHKNGNIGLHPFCSQYIEETERDFRTAQAAFSKIKLAADGSDADNNRNTDASVGGAQHNVNTSAYSGKVYSSFHEAYSEEFLNEGISADKVDESVLAMVSTGVALTSLAVRAGQFLYQRYKKGKPVGEPKQIQVTKESTREICYAIINNYADKYVNMQQVFRELGINSQSLVDIDASACDKLTEILKKYQKPEKNSYTKQYGRIEKAYRKMLKHYYAIGDGIISNFVKYSEAKDEKHSNLIVASREKLQNMWDSQKEFYDNNFSHVLIEIVSSEAYINYLDFIIEKVIPVFKSGLAGDADYVLDIVPKKGEYYLLRQTGNGQAVLANNEVEKGNVAIAEVINFDRESKKMKFKLIGLVKGKTGDNYTIGDDGVATLSTDDIDYDAYKDHDEFDEKYNKWLSLDPVLLDWTPERNSAVYKRTVGEGKYKVTQFLYAKSGKKDKKKGYNTVYLITTKGDSYEIIGAKLFSIDNYLQYKDFKDFVKTKSDNPNENMGFEDAYSDRIKKYFSIYEGNKPVEPENVHTTEELVKRINEKPELDQNPNINANAESPLYARATHTSRGREIYEYMFATIEADEESLGIPMKDKLNEEGEGDSSTGDASTNAETTPVIEPGTDNAKKDLVKTVFVCNIDVSSGKTIFDPVTENKFDGSSIEIDPACSIDEFDKKAKDLEFEKVDKIAAEIKQIILGNILKQTGSIQKASYGKISLDQLDKAVEEIENREGASDNLSNDAGKLAQKIINEYNKLGVGDDWFNVTSFIRPSGSEPVKGLDKLYLVKKEKMQKPYITFDTGIKRDGKDDNVIFYIYPTLIKEGNDPKANRKHGIIIYYNENIFQVTPADSKNDIEKAIKNINDALVNGKPIEASRFVLAQGESGNGSENKRTEDLLKQYSKILFDNVKLVQESGQGYHFEGKPSTIGEVKIVLVHQDELSASFNDLNITVSIRIYNENNLVLVRVYDEKLQKLSSPAAMCKLTECSNHSLTSAIVKAYNFLNNSVSQQDNGGENVSEAIMSISPELLEYANKVMDVIKFRIDNDVHGDVWTYDLGDFTTTQGDVIRLDNFENKPCFRLGGISLSKYFKNIDFYFNVVGPYVNIYAKGTDINGNEYNTEYDGADKQPAVMGCYDFYKQDDEKLAESIMTAVKKLEGVRIYKLRNESVNVTYNHSSEVSESYTTNVNITRKFDKRMRNWFVLSEAIYDDGSNKVSKLDNPRFRKALLERSDCAGFAKTSKLAKFMPYDLKQNYTLVSEHNYTPSVATPLYESVMLVKFDKMDRITEKNYLGKHKIG